MSSGSVAERGPHHNGANRCMRRVTLEVAVRIRRYVIKNGHVASRKHLRVGEATLYAMRGEGWVRHDVLERVLAQLDAEGA